MTVKTFLRVPKAHPGDRVAVLLGGDTLELSEPGEAEVASAADADAALADALTRLKPAEAAAEVAKALGLPRRDLYRRAMELKGR